MRLISGNRLLYGIWFLLAGNIALALSERDWTLAFLAASTLALALVPYIFARSLSIHIPVPFLIFTSLFVFASIFLGEAYDFYNRFWWWDLMLHGLSSIGFGLVAFIFVYLLFEGNKYAAPRYAIFGIAFAIGLSMGTLWELFEFAADEFFGTNMQKTGRDDTMGDIFINLIGSFIGALFGYFYHVSHDSGRPAKLAFDLRKRLKKRFSGDAN